MEMKILVNLLSLLLICQSGIAQWTSLPDNIYADSLAGPFIYGLASGDPTANSVMLWTKLDVSPGTIGDIDIEVIVSPDTNINNAIYTATITSDESKDYTYKHDASGLNAEQTYYYWFHTNNNEFSVRGRTKTAPVGMTDEINIAVSSCSSVFSGYFNAYRRIAERSNLDLVIHLGDYIYDTVDPDEEIRIPEPYPIDPLYLSEWHQRHRYYLLDPDLRAMRQQHPIIAIWDNHDTDGDDAQTIMEAMQAFHDYMPVRQQDTDLHLYRSYSYGELLDVIMMDAELYRDEDLIAPDEYSVLGSDQYNWLINEINNSTATWRIFGSQKLFGLWSILGSPIALPIGNDTVVDPGSWDGYMLEREMLLTHLSNNGIDNNIFLSGDLHFSMALDVPIYPLDSTSYNPETGEGSVGIEMMGGSITRGNLNENGYSVGIADLLVALSQELNPHHIYADLIKHGYGELTIKPDSTIGRFWHSSILNISNTEILSEELYCLTNSNHWQLFDSIPISSIAGASISTGHLYPNPSFGSITWELPTEAKAETDLFLRVFNAKGELVIREQIEINGSSNSVHFNLSGLSPGYYLSEISNNQFSLSKKIVLK